MCGAFCPGKAPHAHPRIPKKKGSETVAERKPEDKAREQLEGIRAKMLLRFGERGSRRIVTAMLIGLVAAVLLTVAFFLIKIDSIEITGDVTVFNETEVINAADIGIGERMFSKSSARIKRNIKANMPIADNIKVRKSIFGKLTINVEMMEVDYYTKIGDTYYALDGELKVLGKSRSASKFSSFGAVLVKLPETRTPEIGKNLVFYDTVVETDTEEETIYEVKEDSFYKYTTDFLTALKTSGYHAEANGVILTEKFEVTLIYAEKFSIRFGTSNDLDVKFRVLYEVLSEGSMQYTDKASIDLSDPSRATARPDPSLDLSEFVK